MKTTIGYHVHNNSNVALSLRQSLGDGFDYIVTPLVHPRYNKFVPFSDVFLDGCERCKLVVYIPKRNYKLKKCVTLIENEFNYSNHIGITSMIIECPDDQESLKKLADIIIRKFTSTSEAINEYQSVSICIKIPLISYKSCSLKWRKNAKDDIDDDSWEKWNYIRMICQSHPNLFVALELNGDLLDQERINRWLGEPIFMLVLPTSIFLTNSSKYPVLSKAHQIFVHNVLFRMSRNFSFIIKGNNLHGNITHYIQYLNHLRTTDIFAGKVSKFCDGYEDLLQIPLQPLKDNLNSSVYEVFETDNIKYQQYELAIYKALLKHEKSEIVAMVVGAGRGPLVDKTLKAAFRANKRVTIYAVEKNINAIVTLEVLRDLRWGGSQGLPNGTVEIVKCDMRMWDAPHKADIVISELLGSFSDNELSPECLDGVWRYVRPDTVCIPYKYTSYLCPVLSHKLYSQLAFDKKVSQNPYEYGYVVHVRNAYLIDEPQPVFTFEHSDLTKKPSERDNNRSKFLTFKPKIKAVCHGFVGYFDCCLFEDIYLSIVPSTQNANMFSWFPIYFPIQTPFVVQSENIELHMTRNVDDNQVWYEWTVLKPLLSKTHNTNGKHYSISLH